MLSPRFLRMQSEKCLRSALATTDLGMAADFKRRRLALRVFRSTVVVPSRLTAKGEPAKLTDVETGMARGASPHRGPMPGGIVLQQSRPVPRD